MTYTIIVGIIALFFSFLHDNYGFKWGLGIAMLLLTFFIAIRWEWGNDMPTYMDIFHNIGAHGITSFSQIGQISIGGIKDHEYGWIIVNLLCQPIGFFGMTILLSIIEGIIVYWFIKKYVPVGYFTYAVFLYVFNWNMMVLGCSMMRQWFAMCIILLAIPALIEGKLFKYILVVYIASIIHTSALLFIPIYFLRLLFNISFSYKNLIYISFCLLIWAFLIGEALGGIFSNVLSIDIFNLYSVYDERLFSDADLSFTIGFGALLFCISILVCFLSSIYAPYEIKIIIWTFVIGYHLLLPFVTIIAMSTRLLFYFQAIGIVAIPNGIRYISNRTIRIGVTLFLILWYIQSFLSSFMSSTWTEAFFEYHTIFEAPYWQ